MRVHTGIFIGRLFFIFLIIFCRFLNKKIGARPYKCDECGREFRQWGDLKYHFTSLHSGVRQYQWYVPTFEIILCVRIVILIFVLIANFVASHLRESIH